LAIDIARPKLGSRGVNMREPLRREKVVEILYLAGKLVRKDVGDVLVDGRESRRVSPPLYVPVKIVCYLHLMHRYSHKDP